MGVVETFLKENAETKNTYNGYKCNLKSYFRYLEIEPDNYFNSDRDYEKDVMDYYNSLKEYAPLTKTSKMNTVKVFLEDNDILFSNKLKKKLRRKLRGARPITLDVIPTNKELKQILSHGEIKAKAMGLLGSSSGMRLNEILQLTLDDIDFTKDPVKIYIRSEITKTRAARITFCSDEAAEAIQEWLKERDKYLEVAVRKTKSMCGKTLDDDTLFCFNNTTANTIWNRLLEKSGFTEKDKSTGIHRLHFHTLRKFFETRMSYAGIPEAIYQQLQGHEGYLSKSYKRYTERELADAYKKGIPSLLIFSSQPDLTDVNESLAKKDKQIKELMEKVQIQTLRMDILENKLEIEKSKNGKNQR